jgi:hypothetical protein
MTADYTCDKCGKVATHSPITETDLCKFHRMEEDLQGMKHDYKETQDWLEECYLKPQKALERRIIELELKIANWRDE